MWACPGTATRRHIATLLCDADERRLDPVNPMIARPDISFPKCFPDAIRTMDYRTAFEQYGDEFDAVLCGSADHHHFGISKLALEHGKPIYCEKPICWSPYEGFQSGMIPSPASSMAPISVRSRRWATPPCVPGTRSTSIQRLASR